jgi:hypothetical protein
MEAHAGTISIGTRPARRQRTRVFARFLERSRARRRERAVHAHAIRAGSPPGPADALYFPPY